MKWSNFDRKQSRKKLMNELRDFITAENYGFGDDNWNLTELIRERSILGDLAIKIVTGCGVDGKPSAPHTSVTQKNNQPLMVRLKVLSRQACHLDKNGAKINGWQRTLTEELRDEFTGDVLAPKYNESPQPGDIVKIKGDFKWEDPESGETLVRANREALRARGGECFHWARYEVDDDECILVTFNDANQELRLRGHRMVNPEFQPRDVIADEKKKPQRVIGNWHFKEVPLDYTKPSKPDGKKK